MRDTQVIKIIDHVTNTIGKEFTWGDNDCTMFAFDVADILVGSGLRKKFQKKWKDAPSAHRYSKKNKLTVEKVLKANGAKPAKNNFEQFADFIIMNRAMSNSKKWRTVGVYVGDGKVALMTEENGLLLVRLDIIKKYKVLRIPA